MTYKVSPVLVLIILFCLCSVFLACGLFLAHTGDCEQLCIPLQSLTIRTLGDPNASKGVQPGEEKMPFWAVGDEPNVFYLGAADPCKADPNGFRFQLKFNTYGAAIEKVTFCPGSNKGSSDPNVKNPQPFVLLSPVKGPAGSSIMTMANTSLVVIPQKTELSLDQLSWKRIGINKSDTKKQSISFEALIIYEGSTIIRLVKTYGVSAQSGIIDCSITIENVSSNKQLFYFNLNGPVGIVRQEARTDERKVIGAFTDSLKNIKTVVLGIDKLSKAKTVDEARLNSGSDVFLWSAIVNKNFAAVIVPLPDGSDPYCRWIRDRVATYYNPDNKADSGDQTIGVRLRTVPFVLDSKKKITYMFQLYLGPKDKQLFEKDKRFRELGFDKGLFAM